MSNITVACSSIAGTIAAPPSKSAAHRALICAALAGEGCVHGINDSDDMRATIGAIRGLGIAVRHEDDTAHLFSVPMAANVSPLVVNCLESGSTLRFLVPVFAAKGISCTFTGSGRLPERPLGVYRDCLPAHGITLTTRGGLPLHIQGQLTAGRYELPGDVSSQFISGLLFALPMCDGDSNIVLTSPLESAAYVDMTIDALRQGGVMIHPTPTGWQIPGGQLPKPHTYTVEGDWSQAAFLLAMGVLGGEITVTGLNRRSPQGDRAIVDLLRQFGGKLDDTPSGFVCRRSSLRGIAIDATQIPDLVPILAVVASLAQGQTTITGAARLRLKESDRLAAITHCLRLLGADITENTDGLVIRGRTTLRGGVTVPGYHDHRIVMSMAVAALGCEQPVVIEDAESVAKSWPGFFEEYKICGGEAYGL